MKIKLPKFRGWPVIVVIVILLIATVSLAFLLQREVTRLRLAEIALANAVVSKNSSTQLERFDQYFVTADNLPEFIERMEGLAAKAKIDFELTDAGVLPETAPATRLTFGASGTFPALFQVLSQIDNLPFALHFSQATIVREKDGKWSGNFTVDVTDAPKI